MTTMPPAPIEGPFVWTGREQAGRTDWIHLLDAAAVAEIEAAVAQAHTSGKALAAITRDDFPLPTVAKEVACWMHELDAGRGFVLVRGLPVERWGEATSTLAYVGLGAHMGTPVSQNPAGDLLGHVRDTGADPRDPSVRLYKTREDLGFHTDGADLIGLLCLRTARSGGTSRIASSVTVYNEIVRRRPDLAPLLFEPFHFDRNEEQAAGEPPTFPMPLCFYDGARLRTFYIGWYIRGAQRHADVPRLTSEQHELLDLVDAIAGDPSIHLDMEFEPGDIQLLKNSTILHARTEYHDWEEPARKRHLLRLWLTAHRGFHDTGDFLRQGIPKRDGAVADADEMKG